MEKRSLLKNTVFIFLFLFGALQTSFVWSEEETGYSPSSFGKAPVNPLLTTENDSNELSEPVYMPSPGQLMIRKSRNTENSRSPASAKSELPSSELRQTGIQEISLIAGDLGYFPRTIFVQPEIPVRIYVTSSSSNALCMILDEFQIRKQIKNKEVEEITFTPKKPGTYRFYCPVNGASGNLIVKEFSTDQTMAQRLPSNE